MRQVKALVVAALLAAAVGACCNAESPQTGPQGATKTAAAGGPAEGRLTEEAGGYRFGMTLSRLDAAAPELAQRLRDATTVNLDAPGLKPAAADAMPAKATAAELVKGLGGGEGLVIAASEPDATCSVDGYPGEKIEGAAAAGWHRSAKRLAAGVHSVRVAKDGYYPVETQVLVRPGTYEVIAFRLGKIVMRASAPK